MNENNTLIPQSPRPDGRVRDHLANELVRSWRGSGRPMGLIGIGFVLARGAGVFLRQLSMVSESARDTSSGEAMSS